MVFQSFGTDPVVMEKLKRNASLLERTGEPSFKRCGLIPSIPDALLVSRELTILATSVEEKREKLNVLIGPLTLILLASVSGNLDTSLAPMFIKKSLKWLEKTCHH